MIAGLPPTNFFTTHGPLVTFGIIFSLNLRNSPLSSSRNLSQSRELGASASLVLSGLKQYTTMFPHGSTKLKARRNGALIVDMPRASLPALNCMTDERRRLR
mmetsp:Transcript_23724/g.47192  ORF Transcript_23724/g.47192 Transcript_23724/m.47192 type:complete len:102 (-) Transcript_23724:244-549(-)